MLNCLINHIKEGRIPFYWDGQDDLLKLNEKQRENVLGRLRAILKDIIRNVESNPYIIAEKLCKLHSKLCISFLLLVGG